jgi:DNA polymerase/3'-5' exonuclease PolX
MAADCLQATTITIQQLRHRLPEVVAAVAQRLVGVGRIAAAADLQESMNDIQGNSCEGLLPCGLHNVSKQLSGVRSQDDLVELTVQQKSRHLQLNQWLTVAPCDAVDTAGAIQTLCAAGLFERARQLAGNSAQLLQLIEGQHMQHLVASNNAEELASRGNTAAAVEMFAAQGNWKRAHELVSTKAALFKRSSTL